MLEFLIWTLIFHGGLFFTSVHIPPCLTVLQLPQTPPNPQIPFQVPDDMQWMTQPVDWPRSCACLLLSLNIHSSIQPVIQESFLQLSFIDDRAPTQPCFWTVRLTLVFYLTWAPFSTSYSTPALSLILVPKSSGLLVYYLWFSLAFLHAKVNF